MTGDTVLLYLHGVRDFDKDRRWLETLNVSLRRVGYPEVDEARVIAPLYGHALVGVDDRVPVPPVTIKQPAGEAARANRRSFERRVGAVEFTLGRQDEGAGWGGAAFVVAAAIEIPIFKQAQNYVRDEAIRGHVLDRILTALPERGRLVIVGHSLGSVIAADLLRRLPADLEVVGLVTLGSPVASGTFDVDALQRDLKNPPPNLGWWLNFWNPLDPVASHRGASSVFPWMVDFKVVSPPSRHVHNAEVYLSDAAVARAVGIAFHGSLSQELVPFGGVVRKLTTTETMALIALRYAHLIARRLRGEAQARYLGALREVQAATVVDLERWTVKEGLGVHEAVSQLAFDLADARLEAPAPSPVRDLSKDEAVVFVSVVGAENILRPFDIAVPNKIRADALEALTTEMELGGKFGADAFEASEAAAEALAGGRVLGWLKWGAIGVGAAAILVATGGLALAAAPGLVGAAALTSALATFGPGGMIGGLLTAGTLVTAGGGGVAYGLASPGMSAQTLEAVVTRQIAAADLRRRQGLVQDGGVWRNLVETEMRIRREYERLDEFSDDSSPTLKDLKAKIVAVERAITYLCAHGLEPRLQEIEP